MPVYYYKAMTKNGKIVKNKVDDISRITLMRKLKRNGLIPIIVMQTAKRRKNIKKEKRNNRNMNKIINTVNSSNLLNRNATKKKITLKEKINLALARTQKVKIRDIVIFTQNFYLLKKANFNNIHALSTIIENTENMLLREILEDILAGVEAGENIYSTMEYYEGIFPYIYISMIKSGELSGALTETLYQATQYLEESESLNKKIKGIMVPNLIQFVGLLVMLLGGTFFAIPMLQGVFDSVGSEEKLPAITLWFAGVVDWLVANWYIILGIIAAIAGGIIYYINTPRGRYKFHEFKYRMPIFGQLIYAIDFSRFMRAVLLNIKNGTRIQEALEISKNVVQNLVMISIIETATNNILVGESWIAPFEDSGLSSTMITEMLKIGMQTDLAVMIEKLLEYMQIDIDVIMEKVMKALPQLVYMLVGAVLIFFVIVVLVPVIQVYMGTFLFSAAGVTV